MYRSDSMHPVVCVESDLESACARGQRTLIAPARQDGEQAGSSLQVSDYVKQSQMLQRRSLASIDAAGDRAHGKQRALDCIDQFCGAS